MSWETEWKQSLRTADDLADEGLIPREDVPVYGRVLSRFKFSLPRYYANLIDRKDPSCPIRKQAIPSPLELEESRGWSSDPLADLAHQPERRITHRYPNRALLHLTPNCSMYCRYCFRKSLLNELSPELFTGGFEPAFRYFETHPEIQEVIFSGGDPFMSSEAILSEVLERFSTMPNIKRLRFHTRVPVTFPSRVTQQLTESLSKATVPIVVVTHFNHPRELTSESIAAVLLLKTSGATLLNQSVLLEGVNADSGVLGELSEKLFEAGILPYYLHHPDRAQGTAHFDVLLARGAQIHQQLKRDLPGYLVPKYVIDVVGYPYKMTIEEFRRRMSTPE